VVKVVMFVRNEVTIDARVTKEAASLTGAGHEVTIIGALEPDSAVAGDEVVADGVRRIRVRLPRYRGWWRWFRAPSRAVERARRAVRPRGDATPGRLDTLDLAATWYLGNLGWARAAAAAAPPADVYHGHDLTGLPAAVQAAERNGGRVVYDSHELYIAQPTFVGRPRRLVARIARQERAWAGRAAALVTVNEPIAERLRSTLGIERTVVVHNCPPRPTGEAHRSTRLRDATKIPADVPIALYHGSFREGRGLEALTDAFGRPELEGAALVFLGFGPLRDELTRRAALPSAGGRVHVLPAVPQADLVDWVTSADVEVIPFQREPLNHYLATPNKLFEALAAGTPVVGSDIPGIRAVLLDDPDGPLGAVCDPTDPGSIATAIRSIIDLPPDAATDLRRRCREAAIERWNWETEAAKLVSLYGELEREGAGDKHDVAPRTSGP
jgi:glycosyltransferase involved in cell wall biosynthesis